MSVSFDASASILGYLFQCRLALVDSIPRLRYQGSFKVSIETLEDVVFETSGQLLELLQTKHHAGASSGLGDFDADPWKTHRIRSDGLHEGRWPDDTIHYLATTATAQPRSVASNAAEAGTRPSTGRAKWTRKPENLKARHRSARLSSELNSAREQKWTPEA